MHQHAVETAKALYQDGTLTLEQSAGFAGVTPVTMRERLGATEGSPSRKTSEPTV